MKNCIRKGQNLRLNFPIKIITIIPHLSNNLEFALNVRREIQAQILSFYPLLQSLVCLKHMMFHAILLPFITSLEMWNNRFLNKKLNSWHTRRFRKFPLLNKNYMKICIEHLKNSQVCHGFQFLLKKWLLLKHYI